MEIVVENMGHTCDECANFNMCNGICMKFHEERHSCGEDVCEHFDPDPFYQKYC